METVAGPQNQEIVAAWGPVAAFSIKVVARVQEAHVHVEKQ